MLTSSGGRSMLTGGGGKILLTSYVKASLGVVHILRNQFLAFFTPSDSNITLSRPDLIYVVYHYSRASAEGLTPYIQ